MSGWRTAGYGSTLSELYRHDAPFVDKISPAALEFFPCDCHGYLPPLCGKPAARSGRKPHVRHDKALGLTVPDRLLVAADENEGRRQQSWCDQPVRVRPMCDAVMRGIVVPPGSRATSRGTTGQGGATTGQGGASEQQAPAQQNQGTNQPSTSGQGGANQQPAPAQHNQGANKPSTSGQGGGAQQQTPAQQNQGGNQPRSKSGISCS
jgi:hypothetical protein